MNLRELNPRRSCPAPLVQVLHDLQEERVETQVQLALCQQLDAAYVFSHQRPQVRHLLQQFGEELRRRGVNNLQLELQSLKNLVLEHLDGFGVHQTGPICSEAVKWHEIR